MWISANNRPFRLIAAIGGSQRISATRAPTSLAADPGTEVLTTHGERIQFLDGLRGVAILMVMIWHAYGSTYSAWLPYGATYNIMPVRVFWIGVQLFFLISGFVIMMTLESCVNAKEFFVRRWLRLFPAMLIGSLVLLAFNTAFHSGPMGDRTAINLIPGLLFISPSLIHTLTGFMIESMDGPYWSIYVEVMFYLVFGLAFFMFGKLAATLLLFSLFATSYLASIAVAYGLGGPLFVRISAAMNWLGFIDFGWFTCGVVFFEYYKKNDAKILALAVSCGALSAMTSGVLKYEITERLSMLVMVSLWSLCFLLPSLRAALTCRPLLFLGFVSYPLYLIHENILISSTSWLGTLVPTAPALLMPLFPAAVIIAIAWFIARFIESPTRNFAAKMIRVFLTGLYRAPKTP